MKKQNHIFLRYLILLLGLTLMAAGIVFSIKADLGTSPISSLPYVAGLISGMSVGVATILLHLFLVAVQIVLLREKFEPIQLLQLLVGILFGFLIDGADAVLSGVTYHTYGEQWLFCAAGIFLVAAGVSLEVLSDAVVLAGEGAIRTLAQVTNCTFGNMKIAFDVTLVILSVLLGWLFLYQPAGVGAGTVAAAVFVGLLAKFFLRSLRPVRERLNGE